MAVNKEAFDKLNKKVDTMIRRFTTNYENLMKINEKFKELSKQVKKLEDNVARRGENFDECINVLKNQFVKVSLDIEGINTKIQTLDDEYRSLNERSTLKEEEQKKSNEVINILDSKVDIIEKMISENQSTENSIIEKFTCKECRKKFNSKSELKEHYVSHQKII